MNELIKQTAMNGREWILDKVTEKWKLIGVLLLLAGLGIVGFLAVEIGGTLKLIGTLIALVIFALLMKFPEAFSSVGGTDVEMPLAVIIAATQGFWVALAFILTVSIIGSRLINEAPQYTAASIGIFSSAAFLTRFVPINEGNMVVVAVLFIIVGFIIGAPIYLSMGNPIQTLVLYCFVNIVWNYVLLSNFSHYFLPALGGL